MVRARACSCVYVTGRGPNGTLRCRAGRIWKSARRRGSRSRERGRTRLWVLFCFGFWRVISSFFLSGRFGMKFCRIFFFNPWAITWSRPLMYEIMARVRCDQALLGLCARSRMLMWYHDLHSKLVGFECQVIDSLKLINLGYESKRISCASKIITPRNLTVWLQWHLTTIDSDGLLFYSFFGLKNNSTGFKFDIKEFRACNMII